MQWLPCAHVPAVPGIQASQSGMMLAPAEGKFDAETASKTAIDEEDDEDLWTCVELGVGVCGFVSV